MTCWSLRCGLRIYRQRFCAIHFLRYVVCDQSFPTKRGCLPVAPLLDALRKDGDNLLMIARRLADGGNISMTSWHRTLVRLPSQDWIKEQKAEQIVCVGLLLPWVSVFGTTSFAEAA